MISLAKILISILNFFNNYSSFITAIATVVLSILTYLYIQEIRKERRKEAVQLIASTLYDLLSTLQGDIYLLKEENYIANILSKREEEHLTEVVYLNIGKTEKYFKTNEYLLHGSLIPKKFRKKIEKYNELYLHKIEKLKQSILEVVNILPEDFINLVETLTKNFEEEYGIKAREFSSKVDSAYYALKLIIEHSKPIKRKDYANRDYVKFWMKYGSELTQRLFENREVKEKIERVWGLKEEILNFAEEYSNIIKELLKGLVKKYGVKLTDKFKDLLGTPSVYYRD